MNKHSQLAKWFRTLLAVLIPSFIICTVLCIFLLNTFEKSIIENNTSLTRSSQNLLDERLRECVYLSDFLSITDGDSAFAFNRYSQKKVPSEAYDLCAQLRELTIANEGISGIFIYYPESDMIVGNMGCYPSSSYYVLQQFPNRDDYDKWISDLLSCTGSHLISLKFPGGPRLCYCRAYIREHKTLAVTVIQLNSKMISELLSSAMYHSGSAAAILSDGSVVLSVGDMKIPDDALTSVPTGADFTKHESSYIFKNSSAVMSDVNLLHVYSSTGMMVKLRSVTAVCSIVLFCFLFAALYFALRLSKRNATPVDNIVSKLVSEGISDGQNELDFISNQIDKLIYAQSRSDVLLNEYQLRLDDLFINSLIHDQYQSEAEIGNLASRYGFEFIRSDYQVMIIHMKENVGKNITAYINELGSVKLPDADMFISCRKNLITVLLNTDAALSRAEVEELSEEIHALSFASLIDGIGVSSACESPVMIPQCFDEAMKAVRAVCGSELNYVDSEDSRGEQAEPVSASGSDKKKQSLAHEAKAIADRCFTDPNLSVTSISEQLNVSNSYLSTVFKSTLGINMLQYINQLRIDHAKELLTTTDLNIKDIAFKVGFSSDISFIRAFRRLEGRTPTDYRSSNSVR